MKLFICKSIVSFVILIHFLIIFSERTADIFIYVFHFIYLKLMFLTSYYYLVVTGFWHLPRRVSMHRPITGLSHPFVVDSGYIRSESTHFYRK